MYTCQILYVFLVSSNVHAHTSKQHKGSKYAECFLLTLPNYAIYILLNVLAEVVYETTEPSGIWAFFRGG